MQHRVRLSDADLDLIVAALSARRAMRRTPVGRTTIDRLIARLSECTPGNPALLRAGECVHGVSLRGLCGACIERTLRSATLANRGAPPTPPIDTTARAPQSA